MLSGQFKGFSILCPDFRSSKRFSKGTPGYGEPPSHEKRAKTKFLIPVPSLIMSVTKKILIISVLADLPFTSPFLIPFQKTLHVNEK